MSKNIYDQIGRPSITNLSKIRKLLEPLKIFFGIDRFWRSEHHNDGSYSLIGNYPPTAEIFFGQALYLGHPYFRNPIFFKNGYVLPELSRCQDFELTQGKITNSGDCYHLLTHFRKNEKGFVEYGFASSRHCPGFETIYLNNLGSIDKFIDYFEMHGSTIINEANEYRINISKLLDHKYNEKPVIASNILLPEQELQFLVAIEKDKDRAKSLLSLTKSERSILSQYLTGCTAKDIAKNLFRSPRTIEKHLENIKCKLCISSRSELFDFLTAYREFL
jgi:DNA-binding CsgD family transcriptional regulator